MFFPSFAAGRKWVFALLAVAFGVGFVAFGVGTGVSSTSIGDVLQDIIGQQNTGEDIGDAQKKAQENPRDAAAQLAFANALQQAGRARAIAALERYTALAPKDTDALLQLANLWGVVANRAENEAQAARVQARGLWGADFRPTEQPVPPGRRAEQDRADPGSRGERARPGQLRGATGRRQAAGGLRDALHSHTQRPEHLPLTRSRRAGRPGLPGRDRRLQAIPRARPQRSECGGGKAQIKVLEQALKGNPLLQQQSG